MQKLNFTFQLNLIDKKKQRTVNNGLSPKLLQNLPAILASPKPAKAQQPVIPSPYYLYPEFRRDRPRNISG
jgi:hypothetical protein